MKLKTLKHRNLIFAAGFSILSFSLVVATILFLNSQTPPEDLRTFGNAVPEVADDGLAMKSVIAEDTNELGDLAILSSDPALKTVTVGIGLTMVLGFLLNLGLRKLNKPIDRLVESIKLDQNEPIEVDNDYEELRDITASFNAVIAKLNTSLSAQKRFNASMAHELKTPLSIIKTHIDVLNGMNDKTIKDYQDTIDVIHQTVRKMNALVDTLLDTSQEGTESMNDVMALDEIVTDVVEDLQVYAKEKNVVLSVETETGPKTTGNQVLLYRSLYNLIENAIKYNKPEGHVHVTCEYFRDTYEIKIADTGIGIAEKDIKEIFEPFYRVNNTGSKDGLGLGLSLVKSVIHMHSGTITVTSRLNEGSVFEIHLPLLRKDDKK